MAVDREDNRALKDGTDVCYFELCMSVMHEKGPFSMFPVHVENLPFSHLAKRLA